MAKKWGQLWEFQGVFFIKLDKTKARKTIPNLGDLRYYNMVYGFSNTYDLLDTTSPSISTNRDTRRVPITDPIALFKADD